MQLPVLRRLSMIENNSGSLSKNGASSSSWYCEVMLERMDLGPERVRVWWVV